MKPEFQTTIPKILNEAQVYLGCPYDPQFEWDDKKIYCSELLYKAYEHATGEKLAQRQKVETLKWRPYEALIRRLNEGQVPRQRELISPKAITESPKVIQIYP